MSTESMVEANPILARSGAQLPRGRILITDDEPGIRQSLSMYLRRLGYEVTEAESADAAVGLLVDNVFDLVLSDIALPGTNNGIDLLTQVKAKSPDVDVIMMTGHRDLDFAIDALKRGASDYFKKPFLFDELKHAVERAIERRRLLGKARELDRLQLRHEALKDLHLVSRRLAEAHFAAGEAAGAHLDVDDLPHAGLEDGALRNGEAAAEIDSQLGVGEHPRFEQALGMRQLDAHARRAGRRVEDRIDEADLPADLAPRESGEAGDGELTDLDPAQLLLVDLGGEPEA